MVRFGAVRRGVVWSASAVEVGLVELGHGTVGTGEDVKVRQLGLGTVSPVMLRLVGVRYGKAVMARWFRFVLARRGEVCCGS